MENPFLSALLLADSLAYLAGSGMGLARWSMRQSRTWLLLGYLGIGFVTNLGMHLLRANPSHLISAAWLGCVAQIMIFLTLSLNILQKPIKLFSLGTGWALASLACSLFFPGKPLVSILCSVGCLGLTAVVGYWIHQNQKRSSNQRTTHLTIYWFISASLFTIGNMGVFWQQLGWGLPLQTMAALLIAYTFGSYRLPPLRQVSRQILGYLLISTPVALLLWSSLIGMQFAEEVWPSMGRFMVAVILAILLVSLIRFLFFRAPDLVNWVIPVTTYDFNRILREYSIGISNITEMNLLATVSIGLISEAIEINRGYLFEVEYEVGPGQNIYRLHGIGGMGEEQTNDGVLDSKGPIAETLKTNRQVLTQQAIINQSRLQKADPTELSWFQQLDMDIFIPIHAKEDWIGLLALGPKTSGYEYSDADITLLITLADQLSLALQNTRLVSSLMRVNNDFRRAYAAMEQSNRQLQQAVSQLEQIDRTKTDFISVSSHELRTPLTVMRGYTEMMLEDPVLENNSLYMKMLNGIHSGILRLHEIVESMLDVASIDARSLHLHKEDTSLLIILRSVYERFRSALDERKQTLQIENLRDLPNIKADPVALEKVFRQLVSNAIKYTPDGGTITVLGAPVSVGHSEFPQGGVEIIISDTGIGIAPENLELIFKKFYQTGKVSRHSTGKTKFKGSGPGLGLAIVKGIVEAHGGKIWVESAGYDEEKLPGSHFHIIFPIQTPLTNEKP